jgi:hypothetical protein
MVCCAAACRSRSRRCSGEVSYSAVLPPSAKHASAARTQVVASHIAVCVPCALGADALLRKNLLVWGLGGVILPFIGIKLIDLVMVGLHLAA